MTTSSRRLLVLALLATALVLFAMAPSLLKLDPSGTELWYVVGWIAAPFVAGLASLRVAARCDGSGRKAWRSFAVASFLWMAGTITWASYGWVGAVLPFPSLADALYISTGVVFMIGMFHYSLPGSGGSRIQVTNFTLAISAVVAIGFILYFPLLANSTMGWFGALLAFAYPALSLSTFAFGLICYCLYVPSRRRFPFLLILGAVGVHTIANFFYGFDILKQSYSVGARYDVFWIAAYAFVTWAALEHSPAKGLPLREAGPAKSAARPGEALLPALSLAAILLAGVAARWPHLRPEAIVVVPLMFGFAALLAIREHALFAAERKLRDQAEETARRLAESEEQLSSVLANTTDGVIVLDTAFRITFANKIAVDMLFSDRPYLGLPMWVVLKSSKDNKFYQNYRAAMEQQTPLEFEAYFPPLDRWFEDRVFPTPDNLTIFFCDVTERRRRKDELTHLAQHDPLTNLANRMLFAERLAAGLQSGRRQSDLVLVLIDLNNFKAVNDSMGHQAGDCLLKQFASRLAGVVRHGDTVARLGGDEFAIIQPGPIEADDNAGIARRISEALLTPFDIQGSEVTLAASIGIAVAPQHGTAPDELVRSADLALYRAKAVKGTSVDHCIFQPGMEEHWHASQSLRLDLRTALANGEFELAYQPIVNLQSGRIARFEALLRWNHPSRGLIAPDEFIPIAEETGLIASIGHWVLRQACADASEWPRDINLVVNLSRVQLEDEDLVDKVHNVLLERGLEPHRLEVEITESVLVIDSGCHLKRLHQLQDLGVRIALDDFATGYSSLVCLRDFPFKRLKIDRSFVGALPDSVENYAIIRAIAGLGHSLGIATTAEGIETQQQLELVRAQGCLEAQGFLFSRPVPADRIPELIQRKSLFVLHDHADAQPQPAPERAGQAHCHDTQNGVPGAQGSGASHAIRKTGT